jgi:hypothetical protein
VNTTIDYAGAKVNTTTNDAEVNTTTDDAEVNTTTDDAEVNTTTDDEEENSTIDDTKEVNKEQPSYRNLSATATRVLQCTVKRPKFDTLFGENIFFLLIFFR